MHDDIAKWEMNSAGDPETQADSRCRAISDAKIFKCSTPLITPGCRITKSFLEGSQEHPYVPCPHCQRMQILEWENMAATLDPAHPEKACFSCIACGGIMEERRRPQMLSGFEWRAHNPAAMAQHRSFSIWSAYSPLQSWEQIAREWIKARGDPASERTFWNDTLGRAYETRGDGRPWQELADPAAKSDYSRGTVPRGALLLMLGVDCQLIESNGKSSRLAASIAASSAQRSRCPDRMAPRQAEPGQLANNRAYEGWYHAKFMGARRARISPSKRRASRYRHRKSWARHTPGRAPQASFSGFDLSSSCHSLPNFHYMCNAGFQ